MNFPLAHRVSGFGLTIFSEMSRLAAEHGAVNLGQGFPDFDGPEPAKDAASAAIRAGQNQYAPTTGTPALRQAIARHARRFYGQDLDPEAEITVTSGATEAMLAAFLGLLNPGDEVVMFEPYFDSYVPHCAMVGAIPRLVPLRPQAKADGAIEWVFDPDELAAAFNARTRLCLLNTPHNPTGKVFSEAELRLIAELCQRWDVLALSDEVYEHLVYPGARHTRLAALPGMAERTLTVGSSGKIFNFTGWKIGWAIGPAALSLGVRRAHQYITFCSATPLQGAVAAALDLDDEYYQALAADYTGKRDYLTGVLRAAGLRVSVPQGTYFCMADFSPLGFDGDDVDFCRWLTTAIGVAAIPASAMYAEAAKPLARHWARFAFCKRPETLAAAAERLQRLRR
ncbi:MAG: aminotransferase class I/II-fold pyridoxal phosphate-dependent enzyme [Anaerolineales bacterium]|nr:aminotransferase class I/II-fold pyridoxal phosphate-dependent enzyme [Anaerolineales bacterium]